MTKAAVLDSSVFISSLKGDENTSVCCDSLIEHIKNQNLSLIEPTILLLEVIDAVGRNIDEIHALKAEKILIDMIGIWVDCDINFCIKAGQLGYAYGINSYDAIYAETAKEYKVPLVTLDVDGSVKRLSSSNFGAYSAEEFLKSFK